MYIYIYKIQCYMYTVYIYIYTHTVFHTHTIYENSPCFLEDSRGVVVQTVMRGDGITYPKSGDRISVHYTGKLASNGRKFDSTYDRCLVQDAICDSSKFIHPQIRLVNWLVSTCFKDRSFSRCLPLDALTLASSRVHIVLEQ